MREHGDCRQAIAALVLFVASVSLVSPISAHAQSGTADWETAAGGKMSFEVASVKPNASQRDSWLNIAQEPDDGDDFTPSGGLFDARDWPLWMYVAFAYKLPFDQAQILRSEAPKWVVDDNFDIQGRATGNPSKDQYRLMVQALLADRFKMAVAWQTRQGPVDVLELAKVGQLGPQLRPFPDGFPCATSAPKAARGGRGVSEDAPGPSNATVPGGFPAYCGTFVPLVSSTSSDRRWVRAT